MRKYSRKHYLFVWGLHIDKLEKLTCDHAAAMNKAAFQAIREELMIYAKVAWDKAVEKGIEAPMP